MHPEINITSSNPPGVLWIFSSASLAIDTSRLTLFVHNKLCCSEVLNFLEEYKRDFAGVLMLVSPLTSF